MAKVCALISLLNNDAKLNNLDGDSYSELRIGKCWGSGEIIVFRDGCVNFVWMWFDMKCALYVLVCGIVD
mgnify:CR=1 FL=1